MDRSTVLRAHPPARPRGQVEEPDASGPHPAFADLLDITSFLDDRPDESQERTRLMGAYYAVKRVVPRRLQLTARRLYARRQSRRTFPAWPIEPIRVDEQRELVRHELSRRGARRVPVLNPWPDGHGFAVVLTHDVEGPDGLKQIERLRAVERRYGLVSAWYFVAEDYDVPPEVLDGLRGSGCEVGLHGVTHDGSLFRSRRDFEAQLPRVHQTLDAWDAAGFRSPATHRNAAWMHELGCSYDTSFPDTDPFEPQGGGCCSILPFFLKDLVELPITLPQDHTLFEILGRHSSRDWTDKASWVAEHHGLVNVIVHPDYVDDERLGYYDELLRHLLARGDGWHALPREVAEWWRARAALQAGANIEPEVQSWLPRATVAWAREDGDAIVFES